MELMVLLVDDEPGALRFLAHMIASRCVGWQVMATAENGRQALAAMEASLPDMVITDIRMPVMDGIELAEQVKQRWPQVRTVVISGYEDFGAAQNAIRHGVAEYLLKPVTPAQLVAAMENARRALAEHKQQEAAAMLACAMRGEKLSVAHVKRCFGSSRFRAALVRTGTLLSRYSERHPSGQRSLEASRAAAADEWLLVGRDEWELIVFQSGQGVAQPLEEAARAAGRRLPAGDMTIVLGQATFTLAGAPQVVQSLMRVMDKNLVLGSGQVLSDERPKTAHETAAPVDSALEQRIAGMTTGCCRTKELRELMGQLFAVWEQESRPLVYIVRDTDKLLTAIERGLYDRRSPPADHEQLLEDAVLLSRDVPALCERVWNLALSILRGAEKQDAAPGSEAFFERVSEYIEQNLSRQITLQNLCAAMGISQTYMSRIFRRRTGSSFSEFLTDRRIERAKHILREQSQLPIGTVAELVGYKDPLYFSKVFRAVEGTPPSRYAAERHGEGAG